MIDLGLGAKKLELHYFLFRTGGINPCLVYSS